MSIRKTTASHGPFHKLVTILASLIALAGIGVGIWFFIFYTTHEETNDAQVEQYVTPVISRITGHVRKVYYTENGFVHQGDTLIMIDSREYQAQLDKAIADMEQARQHVIVAGKNVSTTSSHAGVENAQLEAARALRWKAQQEYTRYKALFEEQAATEQQLEQMKANYEETLAREHQVEKMMFTTGMNVSEAQAQVPAAQALIGLKQAEIDNARLYLSYTVITAPYDGWVGRRTIQPGQVVKEGQILVLMVSKEKWVTANFKETQLAGIRIGQSVEFRADASGSHVFHGVVESFSPASGSRFSLLPADNATGNFVKIEQRFPVRIRLTDAATETDFLRAGMNVSVVADHKKGK